MKTSRAWRDVRQLARERGARTQEAMLNRALRSELGSEKGWLDRMVTRLVVSQIPRTERDVGRQRVIDEVDTS